MLDFPEHKSGLFKPSSTDKQQLASAAKLPSTKTPSDDAITNFPFESDDIKSWGLISCHKQKLHFYFKGEYDESYKNPVIYKRFVNLYSSSRQALQEGLHHGKAGVRDYLIAYRYSGEEVNVLAKQGHYSETIQYAIDARAYLGCLNGSLTKSDVNYTENVFFNPNLLSDNPGEGLATKL